MCFQVKNFCCFLSLEIGTQVISIMVTLLSILVTVLYTAAAVVLKLSPTKKWFYAGMALATGIQIVTGILLSHGAFQRRPRFLWPWLLTAWTTGGGLLVVSIAGSMMLIINKQLYPDINVVIFAYVIYSAFLLYCACIVNSRRKELLKEKEYAKVAAATLVHNPSGWRYA